MNKTTKELVISLDPGFDSMKVIVNGLEFKFPFNIVPISYDQTTDLFTVTEDYYVIQDVVSSKLYQVGQYAREKLYTNRKTDEDFAQEIESFYTDKRFVSPTFIYVIRTAINIAISKFLAVEENRDLNLEDIKEMNITIGIALPHTLREQYATTIKEIVAGTHVSKMTMGRLKEIQFEYTIPKENIFVFSQTLSAIIQETTNDEGTTNKQKYQKLSTFGPTLIIDAGYYTVGIMSVLKGEVDSLTADSNTKYAMKNVNQRTAQDIPTIKDYMVEHLCQQDDGMVRVFDKTLKKGVTYNVPQVRAAKLTEVCNELIDHLDEKFDYLQPIKHILVTGGTGAAYYDQIKNEYVTEREMFDAEDVMLIEPTLFGHKKSPEYGIAVGCYKGLKALRKSLKNPITNESIIGYNTPDTEEK